MNIEDLIKITGTVQFGTTGRKNSFEAIELSAISELLTTHKLVPIEPSDEMVTRGVFVMNLGARAYVNDEHMAEIYKAMLEAS